MKLNRKTLIRPQYCSLEKLSKIRFYILQSLSRHVIILRSKIILKKIISFQFVEISMIKIKMLTASGIILSFAYLSIIYKIIVIFLPSIDFIVTRFRINSIVQKIILKFKKNTPNVDFSISPNTKDKVNTKVSTAT